MVNFIIEVYACCETFGSIATDEERKGRKDKKEDGKLYSCTRSSSPSVYQWARHETMTTHISPSPRFLSPNKGQVRIVRGERKRKKTRSIRLGALLGQSANAWTFIVVIGRSPVLKGKRGNLVARCQSQNSNKKPIE